MQPRIMEGPADSNATSSVIYIQGRRQKHQQSGTLFNTIYEWLQWLDIKVFVWQYSSNVHSFIGPPLSQLGSALCLTFSTVHVFPCIPPFSHFTVSVCVEDFAHGAESWQHHFE